MADKGFDEGIILRIARKDRDAFAELYRMESDAVYGLALSILRNKEDAEDVMHDAFIRIFNAAEATAPAASRSRGYSLLYATSAITKSATRKRPGMKSRQNLRMKNRPALRKDAAMI